MAFIRCYESNAHTIFLAEHGKVKTISLTKSKFCWCRDLLCNTVCEREDEVRIHLRTEYDVRD
jgi:hypothetical protein